MQYPIKLVIFDCDGVIVDSEILAAKIASELINSSGLEVTAEQISEEYCGMVFADILKDLEQKTQKIFSLSLVDKMNEQFKKRMQGELRIIDNIKEAIEKLTIPYCICSNSGYNDIINMLKLFNLEEKFHDVIFSAAEIGKKNLKPAPDILLYAAQKFNVKPENCLVIEDSVVGVRAANSANMRVVGFTGGSHSYQKHSNILCEAGAETVYNNHKELSLIIQALEQFKEC